jgi:hypothetical protein
MSFGMEELGFDAESFLGYSRRFMGCPSFAFASRRKGKGSVMSAGSI